MMSNLPKRLNNCQRPLETISQKYSSAKKLLAVLFISLQVSILQAQGPKEHTQILFVLDASGSMFGKWQGNLKMESAKKVLGDLVDSLSTVPKVTMALRVYGHQFDRDCKDTKLEVGFSQGNAASIKSALQRIKPRGITPIAYSLEQSANDFVKSDRSRNIVILITDGIEECNGDPCAVSKALQANRVVLKPFVIGLGIDETSVGQFECLGKFLNASNETGLRQIMRTVITSALDNTTIQVNLNDHNGLPTETNVTMSFIDRQTGSTWYNLEHTLDAQKKPDKFVIEATPSYDLLVHTLPPIIKHNVSLQSGMNNVVELDAMQGTLHMKMDGSMAYRDLKVIVMDSKTGAIINVQNINSKVKYLVGTYSLEVLTVPRIRIDNVTITSKAVTSQMVQSPGQLVVGMNGSYVGGIYKVENGRLELLSTVDPSKRKDFMYLQPGRYKYVVRSSRGNSTVYTKSKEFVIKSNGVTKVTI